MLITENILFRVEKKKLEEKLNILPPPCVPVVDIYIELIQEALKEHPMDVEITGDNTLLNMEKMKATGDILVKLLRHQNVKYKENTLLRSPRVRFYSTY